MAKKKFNFDPESGKFFDEEFDDFSIMENDFSVGDEDEEDMWDD